VQRGISIGLDINWDSSRNQWYCVIILPIRGQRSWISKDIEGLREVTRWEGGRGEWEPNQILLQESAYVPSSNPKAKTLQESDEHTNQQCINHPLKVMNTSEKEWDQLDTQLVRYG
jgi:hypothetical protein